MREGVEQVADRVDWTVYPGPTIARLGLLLNPMGCLAADTQPNGLVAVTRYLRLDAMVDSGASDKVRTRGVSFGR